MAEITAVMDTKGVSPLFKGVNPNDPKLQQALALGVRDSLVAIERYHRTKSVHKSGDSKSKPVPGRWTSRSGGRGALGSFHKEYRKGALSGKYGSDLERMAKLEEGGTIKPHGKFLAIPTEHAPKDVWPRYVDGLVYLQSLGGQPLLVRPHGGTSTGFDIMNILRRQVTLPPRPTLKHALKHTEDQRTKIMLKAIDRAIWGRN